MRSFDIYEEIFERSNGNVRGNCEKNGLILYGRVNDELPAFPSMLNKHEEDIRRNGYKVFSFDIFALQMGTGESDFALSADGRIAVLLEGNQRPHETTALLCKLFYGRPQNGAVAAVDANLVLGCFYNCVGDGDFSIVPCQVPSPAMLNIQPEDKAEFIEKLVEPDTFVSAQMPYPHRLGTACPLLTNCSAPLPYFYTSSGKHLVFSRALCSLYNVLRDSHLAYTFSDWSLNPVLDSALGYSELKVKQSRFDSITPPAILSDINEAVILAKGRFETLQKGYFGNKHSDFEPILKKLYDRVYSFLKETWVSTSYGRTGQVRAKAIVNRLVSKTDNGVRDVSDEIDDLFSSLSSNDILKTLFEGKTDNALGKFLLKNCTLPLGFSPFASLLAFLFGVLGIRSSFVDLVRNSEDINAVGYILLRCPYALTFKSSRLKVHDLDLIACFVGEANNSQIAYPLRSVAYLHSYIMGMRDAIIFNVSALNTPFGYLMNAKDYETYKTTDSLLNDEQISIARYILNKPDYDASLIKPVRTTKTYEGMLLELDVNPEWVLEQYFVSGLGLKIRDKYVMDLDHALQFTYIMNRLSKAHVVSDDSSDRTADNFERSKGFVLEEAQRSALKLLKNQFCCLTGAAGSGKTTAIELLINSLICDYDVPPDNIVCLAPTGMAARRLEQCTGYGASTIHSRLRIEGETFYREDDLRADSTLENSVIIFDESSMIAMPLLYKALKKIPEECRLIFVGDIEQLPPIEVGKPFAEMLKFLPFVNLAVSKRAKNNSEITANCNMLISGGKNFVEGSDAKFIVCQDNNDFPSLVAELCKYHIGASKVVPPHGVLHEGVVYSPNDIQVVTPVSKSTYSWSTVRLNDALQGVFNPKKRGMMAIVYRDSSGNDIELREGDRVVLGASFHDMPRFVWQDKTEDTLIHEGDGVLNGDIGYVKKIVMADELNILKHQDNNLVPDTELLKSLSSSSRYSKVWVLTEFETVDGLKYLVAFTAQLQGTLSFGVKVTASYELRTVSLAYAITAHKMQGNQAKLVIAPLFNCRARNFISKNLIYTAWSRAREGLYVLGDVTPRVDSALSMAQKVDSLKLRVSPFDIK